MVCRQGAERDAALWVEKAEKEAAANAQGKLHAQFSAEITTLQTRLEAAMGALSEQEQVYSR